MRRLSVSALVLPLLWACSPVNHYAIRPDYQQADQKQTIRLAVVTAPLPDGNQAVGEMWSEMARIYANQHRDFIAKTARAAVWEPTDLCADGIEGVLHLTPQVWRVGDQVTGTLLATLTSCKEGRVIWSATSSGTWNSDDKGLLDVTQHYTDKYGPDVKPYVAPSFRMLKATLDTLPYPSIKGNDAAVDEKIEVSD